MIICITLTKTIIMTIKISEHITTFIILITIIIIIIVIILIIIIITISDDAKDWIALAMSEKASDRMTPIKAKNHNWLKFVKTNDK
jgi:cell division protein FtsW (lipid II flippase)